jgi:hypothetical protein
MDDLRSIYRASPDDKRRADRIREVVARSIQVLRQNPPPDSFAGRQSRARFFLFRTE